jgi:putative restriction endonuclease
MRSNDFLDHIRSIRFWARDGQRAPHKPLLILYALGRWINSKQAKFEFSDVEGDLRELLEEFGPYRSNQRPIYPFWRLKNDRIWSLSNPDGEPDIVKSGDPSVRWMRSASGGFLPEVLELFSRNHKVLDQTIKLLLEAHFPNSIHDELMSAVGLTLTSPNTGKAKRDPTFRNRVLVAYEFECALCSWDLRLGHQSIGLEAAHIKWHQAQGPDTEDNSLALCVTHHHLFDRGAFSINHETMSVLVSDTLAGSTNHKSEFLLRYNGQALKRPQRMQDAPNPDFVRWHQTNVFRGVARPAT